jgi:hypothetical protein
MLAASVRGPSNQVLSEVLRAGRASTARLSPLSTPDSILMCYIPLGVVARDGEGQAAWVQGGGASLRGHPPAGRQGGR